MDRQSLAQLDVSEQVIDRVSEPPVTELEQAVADILAKRLGLVRVGRRDNFFVLGGHSLLATQVVTQIQTELEVALPLRIVFGHPTVAELAIQIEARQMASRLQESPSGSSADELDILL